MKHRILTLSLILGLATSVSANDKPFAVGDVFFCQTEKSVEWIWSDEKQFKNIKPENFKFSIADKKTIKFGNTGSFSGFEMEIKRISGKILRAQSETSQLTVVSENFSFSQTTFSTIVLQAAICDRF